MAMASTATGKDDLMIRNQEKPPMHSVGMKRLPKMSTADDRNDLDKSDERLDLALNVKRIRRGRDALEQSPNAEASTVRDSERRG
eukprot:scaffold3330_cov128-Isochrysis_galbana.AAC.1